MGNNDKFRFDYDPLAALQNCEKLLGMELRPCGPNKLCGGYYLNGEPHPYRRDKLKAFISRGSVWIAEEGGECVSLPTWLMQYGGAADYKDALRMIKGESQALHWNGEMRQRKSGEVKYVDKDVLEAAKRYDLTKCPLFRWMCRMFPEDRVRETWEKYNVTTDSHNNCVYWYVDQNNRILFDKRIAYNDDGHRKKDFFPGRQYRIGDGYGGRCYFGANLIDNTKRAYVTESEKAVLMIDLMYGRQAVATGGKSNLRDISDNMILLPDYDARDSWMEKGPVLPWWEKWPAGEVVPEHADIGDLIERKLCASGTHR